MFHFNTTPTYLLKYQITQSVVFAAVPASANLVGQALAALQKQKQQQLSSG